MVKSRSSNEHVLSYLDYYCDPANKFDYAVLVNGPWGVGKTHLVEQYIKAAKAAAEREGRILRPLYVSLYGMAAVQEIDDELFRQLHPVLSSKTMKIGWNIVKSSLKTALKIDLDGKDEITVNSSLPEIDLTKYLKTPADALLIFDDLERCSMPIADVLGYINTFVEHNSYKTILIANEAELYAKESGETIDEETNRVAGKRTKASSYSLIKEKLIGQTLEVRSSAVEALKSFLDGIIHARSKKFLNAHSRLVLDLHASSGTENLRLLKHALWDYERLVRHITPTHWSNQAAMEALLTVSLVLAIEVRAGRLKRQQFPALAVSEMVRMMRAAKSKDTSIAGEIATRYPMLNIEKSPLELGQLERLLFEGWVDASDVRASLDRSQYYAVQKEPAWVTAWRGWEVSDQEFSTAVAVVEEQFAKRQFQNNCEMLHVFGLRLFFSQIGAIGVSGDNVVKECKDCLDDLMRADKIEETTVDDLFKVGLLYCADRQVTLCETPFFQTIFSHYEHLATAVKAKRLPIHGKTLLEQMKNDPVIFLQLLAANNVRAALYWDVPVLATIPVKVFTEQLLSLTSDAQATVFATLKARYETGLLHKQLKTERAWLSGLSVELMAAAERLPALSRFRVAQRVAHNITPYLR